jgi:hypothetical protein
MLIPIVVIIIVTSTLIEILLILFLRKSKNRENGAKEYVEGFGYKYIGYDKEFEQHIKTGIAKYYPTLRGYHLSVSNVFLNENDEEKRLYFEMNVSSRNYYQKYFCMLIKEIDLSVPEVAIVPRNFFSKMFISKKNAFIKLFIVKPKNTIDNLPYELKEQLMNFKSVGVVYKDKQLLISKPYSHKELPIEALRICEEVYEYVKAYLRVS